ncbi:MAG TPA: tyrosine-type recombinase/integrase [Nocardioidaceae bacterium]|nr:tyrosine-type recombinase/integrase [Nocardioidaceae bacterium]
MSTLTPHTSTYITERRRRGEITQRSAKNLRYALDGLDQSLGHRPLGQLTRRAIDRWMETTGHLAPSTRRNHLAAARGFCRWMVACGLIEHDPTEGVARIPQPRSVPRAMTEADVATLWQRVPDVRARAIVALMVGCGLRCVEVARLTVSDYDPDGGMLRVTGKAMHERELPVPGEVGAALDGYLRSVGGVMSGPLIRSTRSTAHGLSAETISTYMSRWMSEAGLKVGRWDGRSAHALRHTAASDVLDRCHDLRVVQEMLGHQHLSSTSIYLRRAGMAQLREAMEGRYYRGRDAA